MSIRLGGYRGCISILRCQHAQRIRCKALQLHHGCPIEDDKAAAQQKTLILSADVRKLHKFTGCMFTYLASEVVNDGLV